MVDVRVKIEFTVEVDADVWCLNFGTEPSEVREDVKDRARHIVYEQFAQDEVLP